MPSPEVFLPATGATRPIANLRTSAGTRALLSITAATALVVGQVACVFAQERDDMQENAPQATSADPSQTPEIAASAALVAPAAPVVPAEIPLPEQRVILPRVDFAVAGDSMDFKQGARTSERIALPVPEGHIMRLILEAEHRATGPGISIFSPRPFLYLVEGGGYRGFRRAAPQGRSYLATINRQADRVVNVRVAFDHNVPVGEQQQFRLLTWLFEE